MYSASIIDTDLLRNKLYCYTPNKDFFDSISEERLEEIINMSKDF